MNAPRLFGRLAVSTRGLTDDVLTLGPRARTPRAYLHEAVDRLVGADPGFTQLRNALQAVLGIAVGVGLVDGFIHLTGGLQLSTAAGPPAVVAAYNHALLIVSMLLAGMVAMMAGFTVNDPTSRGQLISSLILPVPMIAAMAAGLALGGYRVPSLVFLVALLCGAVYVRRWGPRGFGAGLVAFNGGFLGFFLHAEIGLRDIGWLACDLLIGLAASLAVRFTFFRPDAVSTLERMRRSWDARVRRTLALSTALLVTDDAARRAELAERLRRQVVRLNESTLMIDAQLVESVPRSAVVEAQWLFDAELAVTNCARFAAALSRLPVSGAVLAHARAVLDAALLDDVDATSAAAIALRRDVGAADTSAAGTGAADTCADEPAVAEHLDPDHLDPVARITALAHRLGASATDYVTARAELREAIAHRRDGRPDAIFTPAVALNAGWLPGSVPVSTAASTTPGRGRLLDRSTMPPYVRASIQIGVAATLAIVVGDLVSGARLYWAVLATFLAFMATTNSGEQVRKALFRVAGTAIGIVLGDLLVRVTGGHVWSSLVIVLVALFFGIYLIRVNYTFMVIGITVTMSQLYKQLGEFSWHLLLLRLGETAIGVGAVVVTVLLIVPLRPQRVLTTGVLLWFQALTELLDAALDRLLGGDELPLRPAVRDLDAAYAALEATVAPLRSSTFGRNSAQLMEIQTVSAAARNYARSLAVTAERTTGYDDAALRTAAEQVHASMAAIESRVATGEHGTYVRAAALVDTAASGLPVADDPALRLALRDLTLLDGALARLAEALQMDVTGLDTSDASSAEADSEAAAAAATGSGASRSLGARR